MRRQQDLRPDILLLVSSSSSSPVLAATLQPQLAVAGVDPSRVAAVFLSHSDTAAPPWVGHCRAPRSGRLQTLRYWVLAFRSAAELRPSVIYVREELSGVVALGARRLVSRKSVVVLDKRGLLAEESFLKNRGHLKRRVFRAIERAVARRADRVATVSNFMAGIVSAYGRSAPPVVIPNGQLVSTKPSAVDESYDLVYVGGAGSWQCLEQAAEIIRLVMDELPDARCLLAISDQRAAAEISARYGVPTTSLPPDEARDCVAASRAILALRRDDTVSRAASPIKVGEALAAGTAVVATTATWEGMRTIQREGAAHLVRLDDPTSASDVVSWLEQLRSEDTDARRTRIRDVAEQHLNLTCYASDIARLFSANENSEFEPDS